MKLELGHTRTHTPVLEERVISEVAQPGVPDGLPQLMMVPGRQHSHQNLTGGQRLICVTTRGERFSTEQN